MAEQRIVVLGGSFNPPTMAHQKLLQTAVDALKAEKGLFVPSSDAYVTRKMSRKKTCNMVFSERDRVRMLQTFCSGKLDVNKTELGDDGRGHTCDTLTKIQKKYPEAEIWFIIGDDNLKVLPKWRRSNDLLGNFYFGIIARKMRSCAADIHKVIDKTPKLKEHEGHFQVISLPKDISGISSSIARIHIALSIIHI